MFSNSAGGRAPYLDAIRRACADAGIAVDVAGFKSGTLLRRPEEVVGEYDLVFAKARAALDRRRQARRSCCVTSPAPDR